MSVVPMRVAEDVEILEAGYAALERAWRDFQKGGEGGSLDSIRRLASSLDSLLDRRGVPNLPDLARAVVDAGDDAVAEHLPPLLAALDRLLARLPQDTVRVLVVEDEMSVQALLREVLEGARRQVRFAATLDEARAIIEKWPPDIILLDLMLGVDDGRDLLVELRDTPETAAVPVIVLSAKDSPTVKAECFALGADKYFEKPLDHELLSSAVAGSLQRASVVTQLAQDDPLTGLPNRAALKRSYRRVQSLLMRTRSPLALAVLDLDYLKDVNDEMGHAVGDRLLQALARTVEACLREADTLARWGGDEFVAVFPDTQPGGARQALLKAQRAFRDATIEEVEWGTLQRTFSAGVIQVRKHESLTDAVTRADRALFRAKGLGRGIVVVGDEAAPETRAKRILVVEDEELDAALILRILSRAGFEAERVREGQVALDRALGDPPDLMVLDLWLPDMEGFEVLQRLREEKSSDELPVVILTASKGDDAVARGFGLGADDFLVKPLVSGEFLARVRRLLRQS